MNVLINMKEYKYIKDAMKNETDRSGYFKLAQKVFKLDFEPWYQSGYADGSFVPYTLYDSEIAIAGVGVVTSNFKWKNTMRRFWQISTVMTHPKYRGQGLNRWLLHTVMSECKETDLIYLYANDSVCSYYPKFGFHKMTEYTYRMLANRGNGNYRKLDLTDPADVTLLTEKYMTFNNPFSALTMEHNLSQLMFHCITFLYDKIYYIEQYDAVVIADHEKDEIFCYDIYTHSKSCLSDIISVLSTENIMSVRLGFTPIETSGFMIEPSSEKDTTVFALKSPINPFDEYKVTFPFLSRA